MKYSNEFLLPHILTPIQHETIIGGLLGDSGFEKSGKYPRMKIDRKALDKPYLEWQYNVFQNLCSSGIKEFERFDKRYNRPHQYCSFRTRAVPAFLNYYHDWYPNGKRQVPENVELSPLTLAVWFADDGCVINNGNNKLTLKISIESFRKIGAELLSSKLEFLFKEKFPIYRKVKNKDQFFIKTSTIPAQLFFKYIQSDIININMLRKYNIWKDCDLDHVPIIGRPKAKLCSDL